MAITKKQLLGLLASGSLAALLSCDAAPAPTAGGLDANDCPIGTFRPVGLTDCVFPATDVFGQPIGVSDNRCVAGQPAVPPQCTADNGDRPYLAVSSANCAPGYRFLPGSCNRNTNTGAAGGFTFGSGEAGTTGAAGAFFPGELGTAGSTGTGSGTGAAGDGIAGTGAAGEGIAGNGVAGNGVAGDGVAGTSGTSGVGG